MKRWRDGDAAYVGIGGTGSISCRPITEEQALEAQSRSSPLGFAPPIAAQGHDPALQAIADAVEEGHEQRRRELDAAILNGSEPWGEADWTAADLR